MAKSGESTALDWRPFSFPLVGGVETKVDGIALPPPRLQQMENAYVEHSGSARKRCGYGNLSSSVLDGTTFLDAKALKSFTGRLQGFGARGKALEYSSGAAQKWASKATTVYSPRLTSRGVMAGAIPDSTYQGDSGICGGWVVDAWITTPTASAVLKVSVLDSMGTVVAQERQIDTAAVGTSLPTVRCVARGTKLYVFYNLATAVLRVLIVDTTSAATVMTSLAASPVTVISNLAGSVLLGPGWDVASNSTVGVFLAYTSTTAKTIVYGFVDASGVFAHSDSYVAPNQPVFLAVAVSAGLALHGIAYIDGAAIPNNVYALHRSYNNGTGVWTNTATSLALDIAMVAGPLTIACRYDDATTLRVWFSENSDPAVTSTDNSGKVHQATYTTGNVIARRVVTCRKSLMASLPFEYDSELFYWTYAGPQLTTVDPAWFLRRSSDSAIVARARAGTAYPLQLRAGKCCSVVATSARTFATTFAYMRRIVTLGIIAATGQTVIAMAALEVEFDHAQAYDGEDMGDGLYLGGGFATIYDGGKWGEADFLRIVDGSTIAQAFTATPGSFTALAVSYYWFIYERTGLTGNTFLGTASAPVKVTQGASPFEVQFKIPTLAHTQHSDVVIGVYRTDENPASADADANRIGQVANSLTADEVTFVDTGTTTPQESLYLNNEVDNVAPPAGYIMVAGNGRLFLAGFEDDPNMVRFTKLRQQGQGLQFADSFQILTPSDGGPITALAVQGDLLAIFKQSRLYVVDIRNGPTNAINNQQAFPEPRLISTDTGCASQRSIVLTPMGIMFWPIDGRAPYLLDQSLQINYVGSPVEAYFSVGVTVLSAVLDASRQHVRWALSSGTVVVLDYFHRLWSTFEYGDDGANTVVGPMALLEGEVAMPLSTSFVGLEDSAVFTDAAAFYGMTLKLAWTANPDARLGSLRFRRLGLVGICYESTRLLADVYVDYNNQTSTEQIAASLSANPTAAFRVFERFSTQLAHSMEIIISDDPEFASQAFTLSAVEFELATRKPVFGRPIPSGS